jgi:hypothetical protein
MPAVRAKTSTGHVEQIQGAGHEVREAKGTACHHFRHVGRSLAHFTFSPEHSSTEQAAYVVTFVLL